MRLFIAFLLSLCLWFTAAHAVGTDLCDALGEGVNDGLTAALSTHGDHLGHHVHDHEHPPALDDPSSPADPAAQAVHLDHCHPHQCFTSVLPGRLSWPALAGPQVLPAGPTEPSEHAAPFTPRTPAQSHACLNRRDVSPCFPCSAPRLGP